MVGGARRRRWIILKAAVSRLSATQSLCIQALGKTQVVTRMVNCAAVGNPCGPGAWLPGARSTAVSRINGMFEDTLEEIHKVQAAAQGTCYVQPYSARRIKLLATSHATSAKPIHLYI